MTVRCARDSVSTGAASILLSKILAGTHQDSGRPRAIDAFQHLLSALQLEYWESMKCCHFAVRVTAVGRHHIVRQNPIVTLGVHCFRKKSGKRGQPECLSEIDLPKMGLRQE